MSVEEKDQIQQTGEAYSASSIQVLEGLEAVRKRPAMYIGDVGVRGLHHLVYEVVDNSIDEALAGYCSRIDVFVNEDNSITVKDDGRGIPTDMHEKEGRPALEVVLTVLHAGGKFNKDSYKVSGGLHGVGVSCVNALSTLLVAEVHRGGKIFRENFSKGVPQGTMEIIGETTEDDHGTIITFKPDSSIFTVTEYDYETLASRLRELAYLNKGIRLNITDLRTKNENGEYVHDEYYSTEGLKEFVKFLDASRESLIENTIYIDTEKDGVPVEVAMQYNTSFSENVHSYVNNINTIEGGTHLTGFRRALTRTLKKYAEDSGMLAKLKFEINGDDFREGLTAIVSVKVRRTDQDQTRQRRSRRRRRSGDFRRVDALSGREPERRPRHRVEGDPGRHGPACGPQGARTRAAQNGVVRIGATRQAGRLRVARSRSGRDFLRRGRFRRRFGQTGPRPEFSGYHAVEG